MLAPIPKLTKAEIVELYRWKCSHGHRGIAHYNCYLREGGIQEKLGFFDIECSNLKANFGIIFSYSFKVAGKKKYYEGVVTKKEMNEGVLDKRVVWDCINDMLRFDRIVGHYSTKFDVPYIRTRALYWGLEFPLFGEVRHTDTYYMARAKLCLHSNRQNVIAETLHGYSHKTKIDPKHWIMALQGNEEALKYISKHNRIDVIELEKNYDKLVPFTARSNRSI